MRKFKTVREIQAWKKFSLNGADYDLSHLDACQLKYYDIQDPDKPIIYEFIVTYAMHCFTEDFKDLSEEEKSRPCYSSHVESRPFSLSRYELSKHLPKIVQSLGSKESLIFHGKNNNYVALVRGLSGNKPDFGYLVAFRVFRESKKLRLHVQSAYPLSQEYRGGKKVRFLLIAEKLLQGKELPKAPR